MDYYRKIQERLDLFPTSAPAAESFDAILRILFSPEEAEIVSYLTFNLQPLNRIVDKTGLDAGKVAQVLEQLANRVVIYSKHDSTGEPNYRLLPTIPGLFEFPFMKKELTPRWEELASLWHRYHTEALGNAFAGTDTPLMRVIPVQEAIPVMKEVIPYQKVSEIIETSKYIALTNCACRVSAQGAGAETCGKPLEVCFALGSMGEFLVEQGRARNIDKEEAIRVLNLAEAEGLVHCTENSAKGSGVICNCCGCCCTLLRGITELHNPYAISSSSYIIKHDPDTCKGCFTCLDDRCPVKAITENEDIVAVDNSQCIGCGLCCSVCPTGALSMVLRDTIPYIPATTNETAGTILTKKGTLEAFIKLNQE